MTLRVTLEIIPFGVESDAYTIETVNISNVGKDRFSDDHRYIIERNEYKSGKDDLPSVFHHRIDGAIALARKALETLE